MSAVDFRWSRWVPSFDRAGAAMGLQMAIGTALAVFIALLLRLEHPSWAAFTVLMLLTAQYVGAVQQKAVFRVAGTIAGGVLGYLASGSLQQDPWLYLPLTFVVVAFSVAMFGQSRSPYAFFLTGLTYIVVLSNCQTNPSESWLIALERVEEVSLGVVVTLVVQTTIFPIYANREFLSALNAALLELRDATPLGVRHFHEAHTGLERSLAPLARRSSALRVLLRFGGMENPAFRREIGKHAEMVSKVARGGALLRSFQRYLPAPEPYRSALEEPVTNLGPLLANGWSLLGEGHGLPQNWKNEVEAEWERIDAILLGLRSSEAASRLSKEQWMALSAHLLALSELRDVLLQMDAIQCAPEAPTEARVQLDMAPAWPGAEWIFRGIRCAIGCVIALVLENWLHPPGGATMLLCVYTFTALNAQSPDETGDRSAVRFTVLFTVITIGLCLALIAGTPLLASYAVMNMVIVAWCFLFGYWLHGTGGVTVPLTASFMMLVSIIGLNAQQPVSFPDIVGVFNGLVLGFVLSALIQRLFWPVLPQKNLQRGVCDYLHTAGEMVSHGGVDRLPLWRRTAHVLFPGKALKFIGVMEGPCLPPAEAERLRAFIGSLQDLCGELALCVERLGPLLPGELLKEVEGAIAESRTVFMQGLEVLEKSFQTASPPEEPGSFIDGGLARCDEWYGAIHEYAWKNNLPTGQAVVLLGLGARFRASLLLLKKALNEARGLRLADYLGDVSL